MKTKKAKLLVFVLIVVLVTIVWGLVIGNKSVPLPKDLQEQLIHSANLEVLSLNPVPLVNSDKSDSIANTLLRYPILGHVKINNQNLRLALVNAVSKDIANANHPPTACILAPHHGIHCIDGSNSVLIAICYRCGDVLLERNGKDENYLIKMDSLFPPDSKQLFEKIFKEAGIKTDEK